MCAMKAADILNKTLHFHITVNVKGDYVYGNSNETSNPILKNFDELFKNSKHVLIKHQWIENNEFQELVKKMDLGLQLSFTESFNIVAADFINNDVPILVSDVISWMPDCLKTSTTDYDKVVRKMIRLYKHRNSYFIKRKMRKSLINYNVKAKIKWLMFLYILPFYNK
jgi:hypothetical protein